MKLVLMTLSLTSTIAFAAPQKIFLDSEVTRAGINCIFSDEIVLDQETTVCNIDQGGKKLRVVAKATMAAKNQVKLTGRLEELDAKGNAKVISSPQIIALMDEEAQISQTQAGKSEADFSWTIWTSDVQ